MLAGCSSADQTAGTQADLPEDAAVQDELPDVEVLIPYIVRGRTPQTKLTEEYEAIGFKEITLNPSGTITMVIAGDRYAQIVEAYYQQIAASIDALAESEEYASITAVEYNKDFSEIAFIVQRAEYESGFDSQARLVAGFSGAWFQAFSGAAEQELNVTISIKDADTGEVFDTSQYPQ